MNPFETRIRSKIENIEQKDIIEVLIGEFPSELQERLEVEIEEMSDQVAEDYLVGKLIARKESLVEWSVSSLSEVVEVSHDVPLGVLASIENSSKNESTSLLGKGMNGKVYQSVRREKACYKVLLLERARELQLNIVREAILQHSVGELFKNVPNIARVPEVLGFVEHPDVLAIMMEKVAGNSILDIYEGRAQFPENFNVEAFFEKLIAAVLLMNEHGYFHRDLTNNSGNVMVDREGNPWIIDFGSAIKSINPTGDSQSYQLTAGGAHILAHDLSGIMKLKDRVIDHLQSKVK